jgi:hypothetical protein
MYSGSRLRFSEIFERLSLEERRCLKPFVSLALTFTSLDLDHNISTQKDKKPKKPNHNY